MTEAPVTTGRSRSTPLDGRKLRHMRKLVVMLSQEQLASAAGLSRGEISHLETGKRQPLATTLSRLCVALQCQPEDLLRGGYDEENHYHAAEDGT